MNVIVNASFKNKIRVVKIKGGIQMKANETNIQKVFSKKLALELRKRGFDIIGTEPNNYKPEFNVYIFKNSDKLQQAIHDINKK